MTHIRSRALQTIGAAWLAITLIFFGLRLIPGDALMAQLIESGASDSVIALRRTELGLDLPIAIQYLRFLSELVRGDLGTSLTSAQAVTDLLIAQLWPTLEIAFASLAVAIIMGLLLGAAAAGQRIMSNIALFLIALAISAPIYWTGTLAIYVFTVILGLLPSGGAGRPSQVILPALVLGWQLAGSLGRVTQVALNEVTSAPHMLTASAKGLRRIEIALRHHLRPALPPIIAHLGVQAGFLLGGAVITETIFSRPGIGRMLIDAVLRQDYPVVQGIAIWVCLVVAVITFAADWLVFLVDPRVREAV